MHPVREIDDVPRPLKEERELVLTRPHARLDRLLEGVPGPIRVARRESGMSLSEERADAVVVPAVPLHDFRDPLGAIPAVERLLGGLPEPGEVVARTNREVEGSYVVPSARGLLRFLQECLNGWNRLSELGDLRLDRLERLRRHVLLEADPLRLRLGLHRDREGLPEPPLSEELLRTLE